MSPEPWRAAAFVLFWAAFAMFAFAWLGPLGAAFSLVGGGCAALALGRNLQRPQPTRLSELV